MEFDATFLIAIVSFVVFVYLMNCIFYAPIMKIMQERQDLVEQNYKSAKATLSETEEKSQYRDLELKKTRDEVHLKIEQATQEFKKERSNEIASYKSELFSSVKQEKENLVNSALEAKEVLKDDIVDIAKEISLKILGDKVDSNSIDKSQIREE